MIRNLISRRSPIAVASATSGRRTAPTPTRLKTSQTYYHRNQQYSIVGLTNAAGTLVERYTYSAYGTLGIYAASGTVRTTSTYANRYTYTGREWDAELRLYHFRARWYDPATGGFISRDPLGYVDGMSLYRGYFGVSGLDYSGQKLVKCVCHVGTSNTQDLAPNCGYIEKSVNCRSNELLNSCCKRGCKDAGRTGGTWTGDSRDYQRTVLYKSGELTSFNCGPDRSHLPCGFMSCCLKAKRFHDSEGMEYDTCLNRCKEGDWQMWAGIGVGAASTAKGFLPKNCGYIGWGLVCFGVANHYMCSHLCSQWVCVEFGRPTRERNPNPGSVDENGRPYGHGYYRYYCEQKTVFEKM